MRIILQPPSLSHGSCGATAVETTIVIAVAISTILFLADVSIAVFRYSLLLHSTSFVSRRAAIDVEAGNSGAQLSAATPPRALRYIQDTFSLDTSQYQFTASTFRDANGQCHLVLRGQYAYNCLLCGATGFPINLKTESSALIEDECFDGSC